MLPNTPTIADTATKIPRIDSDIFCMITYPTKQKRKSFMKKSYFSFVIDKNYDTEVLFHVPHIMLLNDNTDMYSIAKPSPAFLKNLRWEVNYYQLAK